MLHLLAQTGQSPRATLSKNELPRQIVNSKFVAVPMSAIVHSDPSTANLSAQGQIFCFV